MNKYSIDKVVGEGSFGKAILCKRRNDGKQCIIKQIKIGKMDSKNKKATEQEATLLSRLHHPNIVTFMESFSDKDHLFIVMEYADGSTNPKDTTITIDWSEYNDFYYTNKKDCRNTNMIKESIEYLKKNKVISL